MDDYETIWDNAVKKAQEDIQQIFNEPDFVLEPDTYLAKMVVLSMDQSNVLSDNGGVSLTKIELGALWEVFDNIQDEDSSHKFSDLKKDDFSQYGVVFSSMVDALKNQIIEQRAIIAPQNDGFGTPYM